MPRLNRIFEELEVHHQDREVPAKVSKSIADKERKGAIKKHDCCDRGEEEERCREGEGDQQKAESWSHLCCCLRRFL